ncbi:MAG: Hsp20/alpha crystallin family protein [Bacteroidota bacterium]
MFRPATRNHAFEWMGENYAPLIDTNHFMGRSLLGQKRRNMPAANIKRDENLYEMEVAVPGFGKEDLEISVKDDILTIRGERKRKVNQNSQFILEEFDLDTFERRFRLGQGIGHEKISAKLENGLLHLAFQDVPEMEEQDFQKVCIQ